MQLREQHRSRSQNHSIPVSSENPWLMVLLIDGSHSMGADWGSSKRSMAVTVEQAVNHLLYDMALNFCVTDSQSEGDGIRDRIHTKIIVYNNEDTVEDVLPSDEASFSRATGDSGWVKNYADTHSYPGPFDTSIEIPRWLTVIPGGSTPMLAAFKAARESVEEHMISHPGSAPPVILNISDGEPTDCGDPVDWSLLEDEYRGIVSLGEEGRHPLVCNVHLASQSDQDPALFPSKQPSIGGLESGLWKISSPVPQSIMGMVEDEYDIAAEDGMRFFVFNSDLVHFHRFLHFSTREMRTVKIVESRDRNSEFQAKEDEQIEPGLQNIEVE